MSFTIKIFLFVLILVQTMAKYDSMESFSKDDMISGLLEPKGKREIKGELVFGNSNEIFGSPVKKIDTPTELKEETNSEKTAEPPTTIKKSAWNEAEQDCNKTKSSLTLYDVYNFLTAGKINEFFYNIKKMISNHEHLKGTPRIFTTEKVPSARKLLSVETQEEGEDNSIKKEESEGDNVEPDQEVTTRSETPNLTSMDLDLDLHPQGQTTTFHSLNEECHGDLCRKPKHHGIKGIITFPAHVVGETQRKFRLLKEALKNSKVLRLVKILATLRSVERSLTKFQYQLPRIRGYFAASQTNVPNKIRDKRFIFKNPQKEKEGVKVDQELTLGKVEAITNILKSYNLESQRLFTDLIILMGDLRNTEYFEKQFPQVKTILHIPKTLIHDYPSLFFKVIGDMVGSAGSLKTSAKGGVKKVLNTYDKLKNNDLSKTKFLYKLLL